MYEIWRSRSALNFSRPKLDGTQSPVNETSTPLGRIHSATVNFKDISIGPEALEIADGDINEDDRHSEDSTNKSAILVKPPRVPHRTKYVIILVGLPGRGKTFLCNKIKCYLNWLGHHTRHFNVGSYRRLQKGDNEVQNADFFDAHNPAGVEARNRALLAALDDLQAYLYSDIGQVAIFDATNTTVERRRLLIHRFHGRFQYLFIESVCTDEKVLEHNYRFKMQYSPDYRGMGMQQSLNDFKARIHKYEEVYEQINDRNLHYIKLIDMVTGRGHMDVNRISGYLPGKIVFFLMQVCKAGMAQARRIWLTRHGESEYNLKQRIGGNSPLSLAGEVYARCLPEMLLDRLPVSEEDDTCVPVSVWTSTLCRTIQTARYLPFPKLRWKALDEIQAGACDGLTYEEIAQRFPEEFAARQKDKLRYRYPAGESYLDVIQRLEPVIIEMEREKECIVVVGHQAVLRTVLGYFMARPVESIPTLDVPLHTLLELRPRPDGTMDFELIPMSPDAAAAMEAAIAAGPPMVGAYSSGSFSGAPSPMPLSPICSMGRHDSPVMAAAAAAAVAEAAGAAGAAPASALAAAGAATWALPPKRTPMPFLAAAVAAAAAAGDVKQPAAIPSAATISLEATAGTMDSGAAAVGIGPTRSYHSRSPSLNSGIGGGGGSLPTLAAGSPCSAFHFGAASAIAAAAVAAAGGADGTGVAVEPPSTRPAAPAASGADTRTRKVRVPFGATMGGGGSEGGAPPDLLASTLSLPNMMLTLPQGVSAAAAAVAGPHSWSGAAAGALQCSKSFGFTPGASGGADTGVAQMRQVEQLMVEGAREASGPAERARAEEGSGDGGGGGGTSHEGLGTAIAVREMSSALSSAVLSLSYLLDKTASLMRSDSHGSGGAAVSAAAGGNGRASCGGASAISGGGEGGAAAGGGGPGQGSLENGGGGPGSGW